MHMQLDYYFAKAYTNEIYSLNTHFTSKQIAFYCIACKTKDESTY